MDTDYDEGMTGSITHDWRSPPEWMVTRLSKIAAGRGRIAAQPKDVDARHLLFDAHAFRKMKAGTRPRHAADKPSVH